MNPVHIALAVIDVAQSIQRHPFRDVRHIDILFEFYEVHASWLQYCAEHREFLSRLDADGVGSCSFVLGQFGRAVAEGAVVHEIHNLVVCLEHRIIILAEILSPDRIL